MAHSYGTQWIEAASDLLLARVDELRAVIGTYDATFAHSYGQHVVADLELPAVTVGFVSAAPGDKGYGDDSAIVNYMMQFEVRVHIAYAGDQADDLTIARLLTSVVNKLKDQIDLTGGYRISEVSAIEGGKEFKESATVGGSCVVTVTKAVLHTQE